MTATNLRALLEAAENDIETYRHPDISEAQERLNEVLQAAGLGSTGSDHIARLAINDKCVYVRSEYSVRGCDCDNTYDFPVWIIDADDPVKAATRWGLDKERKEVAAKVAEAVRLQAHWGSVLAGIDAKIAAAA